MQDYENTPKYEVRSTTYPTGELRKHAEYVNDKRHGLYQTWNPHGQLTERSEYVNDKLHGTSTKWYHDNSNGRLYETAVYVDGKTDVKLIITTTKILVVEPNAEHIPIIQADFNSDATLQLITAVIHFNHHPNHPNLGQGLMKLTSLLQQLEIKYKTANKEDLAFMELYLTSMVATKLTPSSVTNTTNSTS